jgi:hypothetical protein
MDDELCDTVLLSYNCKLRSVWRPCAPSIQRVRTRHDGTHLSKGCTRCTTGLRCVVPLLGVLRFTNIAVLPTLNTISSLRLSNLYDAL